MRWPRPGRSGRPARTPGLPPPPPWPTVIATTLRLFGQRHIPRWLRRSPTGRPARHFSAAWVIRRPAVAVLAVGALAVVAAVAGLVLASQTGHGPVPVGKPTRLPAPHGQLAAAPAPLHAAPVPPPARLIIPAIGVRTRLARLRLTAAATLQPPPAATVAGWYTGSPRPGAIGPAVIAGHIDSRTGPGVFFRLRLLHPGDRVYVRRTNGTLAAFTITAVHRYPKTRFPAAAVYGPAPTPQLRLITCGGTFDRTTGSYLDNIIVYAQLTR